MTQTPPSFSSVCDTATPIKVSGKPFVLFIWTEGGRDPSEYQIQAYISDPDSFDEGLALESEFIKNEATDEECMQVTKRLALSAVETVKSLIREEKA